MNIWVIARSYPTKGNSLRGSFELEQAKMLAKRGHNVTYLALVFHHKNKVKKWGYCTWKEDGITVCVQSQFYAPDRFHLHLKNFQKKKWEGFLKKVEAENGNPDVIHVHYPAMITIADTILEYQKKGVRIVATEHWSRTLLHKLDSFETNELKLYVENADAFLCVGGPLRDAVKTITGTKKAVAVLPNVVTTQFAPEPKKEKNGFDFIAVGRLAPVKQFDMLIMAFCLQFKGAENVRLTIVGGGKEMKKLQKLVQENGLENQVTLTGTLSRQETAKALANADVLVCSSKYETFGVPIIEAWACGKPAVTTDNVGFLDYWHAGLGELVSGSVDGIAAGMKKVYENYDRFDAEQISEFAVSHFSEETICGQLLEFYRNDNCE